MKTDPSSNHEELKALLAQSFHSEEADEVPPLPDGLRDRIQDQYGKELTPAPVAAVERSESIFAKLSRLFAQPQFTGAAAAVVLIAVAAFLLIPGGTDAPTNPGTVRGTADPVVPTNPAATIILYGLDSEKAAALKAVLDPKLATIKEDISSEPAAKGATIIIDGKKGQILGYAEPDAEATIVALPDNKFEVGKAVNEMLNSLSKK